MALAIGIIFVVIGAGFTILSLWDLVDVFDARRWQRTKGVVVVSDLQRSKDSEGVTYRAEIAYRYTVKGEEHVASRARFGDRISLGWARPALRLLQKYPVGREVTVHYDPEKPGAAVLEPEMSGFVLGGISLGLTFVMLGLLSIQSGT